MDARHFDSLTRVLSEGGTRRGLLGLLATLPLFGSLTALLDGDADAKGRRKKRHKHGKGRRRRRDKKKCKAKNNCKKTVDCQDSSECQDPGAPNCIGHRCVCSASPFGPCPAGQICQNAECGIDCGDNFCQLATHVCENGSCRVCDVCDDTTCPYSTVQKAIDDPSGPSTIRICAGIYTGNVTISRNLTLIGVADGREPGSNTILDADGSGSVIVVNEGRTATLQGLRITGGFNNGGGFRNGGGGVRNDGNLTMHACTVAGNMSESLGGGILHSSGGTLEMTDCTITGNHAENRGEGGGMFIDNNGSVTLTNCTVSGNSAEFGGGILNEFGTVTLNSGTSVTDNTASGGGGIINHDKLTLNSGASVTLNTAGNDGGGISNVFGTMTLNSGASVRLNKAGNNGGGIYNESPGKVTLNSGASVTQNTAGSAGGGIYHVDAPVHGTVTLNAGSRVCNNSAPQCVNFTPPSGFCGACPA